MPDRWAFEAIARHLEVTRLVAADVAVRDLGASSRPSTGRCSRVFTLVLGLGAVRGGASPGQRFRTMTAAAGPFTLTTQWANARYSWTERTARRSFADGGGDALGRAGADVADGEQPGVARLEGQRSAAEGVPSRVEVLLARASDR